MNIMRSPLPHITVCICTYKRQQYLKQVLEHLNSQVTEGKFTYSVVVVDNDHLQSGKEVALGFAQTSRVPVKYCCEFRQNIALARNTAVENASGEYVAFLDDDELPTEKWLLSLFDACRQYGADGVLGPAKPRFEGKPPEWVVKGKFFERSSHPTGFVIGWRQGRTGNVLLKSHLFGRSEDPFRPEVRAGEDQDFFRRMIGKGHIFVWCSEALTNELIPGIRCKRTYLLGRALLNGKFALLHPNFGPLDLLKSVLAVMAYTMALPCLLFFGQDIFMRYLVKIFNHIGKLLMSIGLDPMKDERAARLYPVATHGTVDHFGAKG